MIPHHKTPTLLLITYLCNLPQICHNFFSHIENMIPYHRLLLNYLRILPQICCNFFSHIENMIPIHRLLLITYLCILPQISSSSQCPMDLNYVLTLPWDPTSCRNLTASTSNCCQTLTSLYGVAMARHLNQTSLFRLQSLPTSISCLSEFQSKLTLLNLPHNLTSVCFRAEQFVNTMNVCAGIQTKHDWLEVLGPRTPLHRACGPDLSGPSACDACVLAGIRVQSELLAADGDNSHSRGCFYYTILYAGGVVNAFGPESEGALSCIFGLPLIKKGSRKWGLVLGLIGGGVAAVIVAFLAGFWWGWRPKLGGGRVSDSEFSDSEYDGLMNWRPKGDSLWYKIEELEAATDKFSSKNLIGKGQFGIVHKGKLKDGAMIAVKKVFDADFGGDAEFAAEVEMIGSLKHRNLVPLRGCCVSENQKYLVYDHMPNGDLAAHLSKLRPMTWPERKSVILDVANGLAYLHYGVSPPIYHRDIKPTNILLDSCMRARVADFGLARQGTEGESSFTTRIAGTHGYLAPEYALYGQLTEKSDVYSFGIVILEVMSGRKAIDLTSSTVLITDWAWRLVKDGKIEQVLDPALLGYQDFVKKTRYSKMVMERFVLVGILCAHLMVALRPNILEVLKMLEGDIEVPPIPDRPFFQ